MRALRLDIHGNITEVELPNDGGHRFIAAVRELITADGIQPVALTTVWDLWVDEDGITTGRSINPHATTLANLYGIPWTLRGTAVITSADREAGVAATLTPEQITTLKKKITVQ